MFVNWQYCAVHINFSPTFFEPPVWCRTPHSNICARHWASPWSWSRADSVWCWCSVPHPQTDPGNPRPYCSPTTQRRGSTGTGWHNDLIVTLYVTCSTKHIVNMSHVVQILKQRHCEPFSCSTYSSNVFMWHCIKMSEMYVTCRRNTQIVA